MVASVILVDPVSILLHQPDVAYNFVRQFLIPILQELTALADTETRLYADPSSPTNGFYGTLALRIWE